MGKAAPVDKEQEKDLKELEAALQLVKRRPLNFVMFTKGASVVGLLARKKKITDGDAQKGKKKCGAPNYIQGVCEGSGSQLTFKVLEEQSILPQKIKEYIDEAVDVTVKPIWEVVKELPEVKEDDDVPPETGSTAKATTPETESTETESTETESTETESPADELAELSAKMKNLKPLLQAAIVANPSLKDDLLGRVATFKQQIDAKDAAGAQQALLAIAKSLKELAPRPGSTAVPSPTSDEPYQPASIEDAIFIWKAAQRVVTAKLKAVEQEIAAASHPEVAKALIELKAVRSQLSGTPDTKQKVTEMEKYLTDDDVVQDICELAQDIRTPLLAATAELKAVL